ncbi:MAG: hypothetical protein IJ968_00020 [Clostridia bacterium]|nr:hypothetical protein [Clostridia bacterium]
MMKKFWSMLVAVVLLLTVLSTAALAEKGPKAHGPKEVKIAEKAEKKADKQAEKQLKKLEQMVDKANRDIEKAVRTAQKTPYNDIDWLQARVAAITSPVFAYAESIGAQVECTYTTYYIDGQYVDVDPLRVINVIPSDRKN